MGRLLRVQLHEVEVLAHRHRLRTDLLMPQVAQIMGRIGGDNEDAFLLRAAQRVGIRQRGFPHTTLATKER